MNPPVSPTCILPRQNRRRTGTSSSCLPTARLAALLAVAAALAFGPATLRAQNYEPQLGNPTGNPGQFNGNVTTGSSYDPLTGNATRTITDLVVPGSVGAYPLVFARTANSRFAGGIGHFFGDGGNWRHNFQYDLRYQNNNANTGTLLLLHYPDGRKVLFTALPNTDSRWAAAQVKPPGSLFYSVNQGVRDRLADSDTAHPRLLMGDGGQVLFEQYVDSLGVPRFRPIQIIDPFGKPTGISYWANNANGVKQVTEPGGRWLQLDYLPAYDGGPVVVRSVTAWNGQQVIYNYG